jgi:Bacteriophage HK97-gp10, putative tail-component
MISVTSSGDFANTKKFLEFMKSDALWRSLDAGGRRGVDALSSATPIDTSETARSWKYQIKRQNGRYSINWYNTNEEDGVIIAVIIQYGHGTGTGGWVEGIDYINPAMRPVFDNIVNDIWRQVTSA